MSTVQIELQMLGPMTLRCEGQEVRDTDNRARKIWLLLAYMAARRGQAIPQEELVALLWEREERSSNPANALKTMFHRLRNNRLPEFQPQGSRLHFHPAGNSHSG